MLNKMQMQLNILFKLKHLFRLEQILHYTNVVIPVGEKYYNIYSHRNSLLVYRNLFLKEDILFTYILYIIK
jgi:hypothetical protein